MLLRISDRGDLLTGDGLSLLASLPTSLPVSMAGQPVTVLLPPSLSSITELEVGAGEARLLRKTLPWRLEDTLLAPVETVHFAHGAMDAGRVAVVVTDRHALDLLRTVTATHGVQPQTAQAELSLIPWQQGQWTLWLSQQSPARVLVRHGWHRGFACDTGNLAQALTLLHNEQQAWPAQIVLYGTQQQYNEIRQLLPSSLQPLLLLRRAPAWDELAAAAPMACNVLQGAYAPPLPWQRWWRQWRLVAALAATLVLADAGITLANIWRLQSQQAVVQRQLVEQFRHVQPQGAMVDPLAQVRQALAQSGGQHALLPLLTQMAPALAGEQGVNVDLLDFDAISGALQLDVHSQSLAAIDSLRGKLQRAGLGVDLVGSSSEGGNSRARLRVVAP
ncbi:MAG TPA: type II secretion system protein GspL [Candidatus Acidoferrum sp.]|nr:type II secretion system protein GspL [Candidatus Acidoferrum sp.]